MSISDIWYWLINADLLVGAMWAGGIIVALVALVALGEALESLTRWWRLRNE